MLTKLRKIGLAAAMVGLVVGQRSRCPTLRRLVGEAVGMEAVGMEAVGVEEVGAGVVSAWA
jgi:hypothetical protein